MIQRASGKTFAYPLNVLICCNNHSTKKSAKQGIPIVLSLRSRWLPPLLALQAGANPRTDVGRRNRGGGTRLTRLLATRFLPGRLGWLSIGRSHGGHPGRNKV